MLKALLNKVVGKVTYLPPLLAVTLSISYAPLPLHKPRRCLHVIAFHSWLNLHWMLPAYYAYIWFCILSPLKTYCEPHALLWETSLTTTTFKRLFLAPTDAETLYYVKKSFCKSYSWKGHNYDALCLFVVILKVCTKVAAASRLMSQQIRVCSLMAKWFGSLR